MASLANYFAAKILGTEIPEGFRPYKALGEELAHNVIDPFAAQLREGKRIRQLPFNEQIVEQGKRTGNILKETAKVPVRATASIIDAARIFGGMEPMEEKFGIKTYQRNVAAKIASGMSEGEAVANALRDIGLDFTALASLKLPTKTPKSTPVEKPIVTKKEPVVSSSKQKKTKEEFVVAPNVEDLGLKGVNNESLRVQYDLRKNYNISN